MFCPLFMAYPLFGMSTIGRFHYSSLSCIDLIFTSQPSLITDSDVNSSLYPNCHLQIVFAKLNLDIVHPPPYLRKIRHCREANTRFIRRAIKQFNWERAFLNTSVNEKVDIFNRTIFNIVRNKIPNEIWGYVLSGVVVNFSG